MNRLTQFVVLVVLIITTVTSFAQQVPTEKPDPRLEKKITLKFEKTRLPEVLEEVSRQTGVDIRVDHEKRFWAVRQRKVTLLVKDMPLGDFMRQLKLLLGYHIRKAGKEGEYSYIVWQDLKGRKLEQDIVAAQESAKEDYRRHAIYDSVADAKRAISMTPDEIEKAKKTDPWLANLASDPEMRDWATLLSLVPQEYIDGIMHDSNMGRISGFGNMGVELDKLPLEAKPIIDRIEARERAKPYNKWMFEKYSDYAVTSIWISPVSLDGPVWDYRLSLAATSNDMSSHTTIGIGSLSMSPSKSESRLQDEAISTLKIAGTPDNVARLSVSKAISDGVESNQTVEESLNQLLGKGKTKRSSEGSIDPDLAKQVEFIPYSSDDSGYLSTLFEKLSEQTDLNIMYEYFNRNDNYVGGRKLSEVLIKLSQNNGIDWVKDRNTLRFRCNDWALRRTYEIPDDLVNKWRASIEKNYGLTFDDMVDMSVKLTDEQIRRNLNYNYAHTSMLDNPKLSQLFELAGARLVINMRNMLEFYSRLTETQKRQVWSKDGLPIEDVPVENWPQINGAAQLWENNVPIYGAVFLVKIGTEPHSNSPYISFHMRTKVWLKDMPSDMREREIAVIAQNSPEKLKSMETEPIETELGNTFSYEAYPEAVKKLLEEIKADEEKLKVQQATSTPTKP